MIQTKLSEKSLTAVTMVIATLLAYYYYFVHWDVPYNNDWYYFNSLALIVRSSVLHFKTLPILNPWVCGGLDLLANPQNRIFSPMLLIDVALQPQPANLISLMIWCAFGFVGFKKLAMQMGASISTSLIGSALFVFGTWFGLHYAEGHIPFGAMQALPWTAYFAINWHKPKNILGLGALLSIMLLDGAVYAVIYSGMIIVTLIFTKTIPTDKPTSALRTHWLLLSTGVVACALIAAAKIIPVLYSIADRKAQLEFFEMTWPLLFDSLFNPNIDATTEAIGTRLKGWRMHEFGTYLSPIGWFAILLACVRSRSFGKTLLPLGLAAIFWIWVGSGFIPKHNPWLLFQKIPLINNAHVQSRLFLLAFLFFCLAITLSLDQIKSIRPIYFALAIALLGEGVVVRNLSMFYAPPMYEPMIGSRIITRDRIDKTLTGVGWMPRHYLDAENVGATNCYEPAFQPKHIQGISNDNYRGEAFTNVEGAGNVSILTYKPNVMRLQWQLNTPSDITINANTLFGWNVHSGDGLLKTGKPTDLLTLLPAKLEGQAELRYEPSYLRWIVLAYFAGWILLLYCWLKIRKDCEQANDAR